MDGYKPCNRWGEISYEFPDQRRHGYPKLCQRTNMTKSALTNVVRILAMLYCFTLEIMDIEVRWNLRTGDTLHLF